MRRQKKVRLEALQLEARETPAVFAHFAAGTGTLTVTITDGNSGPAGAVMVTPNNYTHHHAAEVYGDFNGSNPRVRVNGSSIHRSNGQVNHPNASYLVRTNEVQNIIVNGSNSSDTIRLDLMENSQGWRNLNGRITVNANGGNDTVRGSKFNDKIYGGNGNDYFEGRGGNDYLNGGAGNDTFDGGSGNDSVAFFNSAQDKKSATEFLVNY